MDAREPLYLHRETRLNLEPASSASIVQVCLPSVASHRRSNLRKTNGSDPFAEEERAYRSTNLSTSSSIFYRKHHTSPRCFLWRVLEDDSVLSIRVVDVCRQQKSPDANIVLNLRFPAAVRPSCIAFSDPEEHDALCVFVVDQSNHLYTLTLRPDTFCRRSALEGGLGEACKIHLSSAFSFKHPHRLVAVTSDQLLVTLHDGGIIKLDKNKTYGATGSLWKETFYNPTGWAQGLRSLLPFQGAQTIKYGRVNMDPAAATSLALTSAGLENTSLLFSVCLDHRLRIWNVKSGQILYLGDLLGAERNSQEIGKWTVDPSQSNLLQVIEHSEGRCLCVTYSPIGAGEFKFWKVTAQNEDSILVEDAFPGIKLSPPTPSSSDVWTLADFGVGQSMDRSISLWTLWKNNMTSRLQRVEFSPTTVEQAWTNSWTGVFVDNSIPTAQTSTRCDPTDATEKWLQLLLYPGRFSKAALETALSMYERGLGSSRDPQARGNKGLAESICAVIGSTATLDKSPTGGMDYEQFRSTSEIQWRRFYRLVVEIDKQRGEALSLSLDGETGMAWVICADCIIVVRECGPLDRLYHNISSPGPELEDVANLVSAGMTFLESFSDGMWQQSIATLRAELFEESSKTDAERLQFFSDKAAFWRQITDEDCLQVVEALGTSFKTVTPALYRQLVSLTEAGEDSRNRDLQHPLTEFGRKVMVKSVQETAELQWLVFFSQLILLVHMEFEFDQEEDALHSRFDVGLVYRRFIVILQRLELVRWFSKTQFGVPLSITERLSLSGDSPAVSNRPVAEENQTITVFEGHISHLLGLDDLTSRTLATTITDISTSVCAPESDIEISPALAQCSLLKRDRPDLALELAPFCAEDAFSTYVQGRVSLALKDFNDAAVNFRKAAVGMSASMKRMDRHSAGLLDDTEWNLLNNGPPRYYAHIVALYEKQRAYSYVIEFARLSLQFAESSVADVASVKTEMLSRLFTASTAILRFDLAYSTLLSMTDKALQNSCLKRLVEKMCETSHNAELVGLPFSNLQSAVDEILQEKCERTRDVARGIQYHQILYAWRINHGDYRGAATIQLDRLQKLKKAGEGDHLTGDDVLETPVTRAYLLLLNTLSCMDSEQAWVITEEAPKPEPAGAGKGLRFSNGSLGGEGQNGAAAVNGNGTNGAGPEVNSGEVGDDDDDDDVFSKNDWDQFLGAMRREAGEAKRKLVTVGQIRKQYQDELDRIAAIQNNQFGFAAGDDDDDIMDES